MTERPRPADTGDRVDVKTQVDEETERYMSGEVIRRFKYNDLSFTLHIALGDNTHITLRYRHAAEEFYVEKMGDVIRYEIHDN